MTRLLLIAGAALLGAAIGCGSSDKNQAAGPSAGGSAGQASGGSDSSGGEDSSGGSDSSGGTNSGGDNSGGSAGSAGNGGSAGQTATTGTPGQAMVAGGVVAKSANFTAILTLGEAPGGNGSAKSANQRLNSGFVGTSQ